MADSAVPGPDNPPKNYFADGAVQSVANVEEKLSKIDINSEASASLLAEDKDQTVLDSHFTEGHNDPIDPDSERAPSERPIAVDRRWTVMPPGAADETDGTLECHIDLYKKLYVKDKSTMPQKVGIYFRDQMYLNDWKEAVDYAISEINKAAPGLLLHLLPASAINITESRIEISRNTRPKDCSTLGSIRHPPNYHVPLVALGMAFSGNKNRATVHEFFHALGFEHEHQRADGRLFITYYSKDNGENRQSIPEVRKNQNRDIKVNENFKPLTPFDPYSITMYKEGKGFKRKEGCPVWQDHDRSENLVMSELDKVALNYVYPPCTTDSYQPKIGTNGMHYCGREVMERHNYPSEGKVNKCGPADKGGPNCPACRVLSKPHNLGDKWQGWSGYVYCGTNNKCQNNYGDPCKECAAIIHQ